VKNSRIKRKRGDGEGTLEKEGWKWKTPGYDTWVSTKDIRGGRRMEKGTSKDLGLRGKSEKKKKCRKTSSYVRAVEDFSWEGGGGGVSENP